MTTDVSPILDKPAFAQELCAWRAAQPGNLTQKQAAKKLGVPPWTYIGWEQGKHKPPGYMLGLVRQAIKPQSTK
jgi:DNA-binding transcriptional regulator YiaG